MNDAEELAAYRKKFGPLDQPGTDLPGGTTHVLMVVDVSGSMAPLAEDVRGGFNTYVADLSSKPGTFRLTATLFDQRYMPLCVDADLPAAPRLTAVNYCPAGNTALLDAVGRTVGDFEARVTVAEADRVLVVIQTDGQENASKEWTYAAVRNLIEVREATGRWSFIYLGAGADTWAQARSMGVSYDSYVNTAASSVGTAGTYSGLTRASVAFAAGASGAQASRIVSTTPGAVDKP